MTPITKNEKLTIWQKIFAGRVTISAGTRESGTLPHQSVQCRSQTAGNNQTQNNNGGNQRKLKIGTHQFFSF
jgi:hypothetical protein